MPRCTRTGPVSPLFGFGAVLTAAGAVMYAHPASRGLPLLGLGALALAAVCAIWISTRQR